MYILLKCLWYESRFSKETELMGEYLKLYVCLCVRV